MGQYKRIKLEVPFFRQPGEYQCSPTCVKMLAEFYGCDGVDLEYFEAVCRTDKYGTYSHNYLRALRDLGLPMRKLHSTKSIIKTLHSGHPVLVSFKTSNICSHTSIIVGHDSKRHLFYLNDPYYGKSFTMPQGILRMIQHAAYTLKLT